MCLDIDVTKQTLVYYPAKSAPFEPFVLVLPLLFGFFHYSPLMHLKPPSIEYKWVILPLNWKPTQSIPKSPASLSHLLVPKSQPPLLSPIQTLPNIPPQPFPQFEKTLNFIVNTDGPYSDPALRHGVFSSASYVDMFLVVCPVGGLFFFFFI